MTDKIVVFSTAGSLEQANRIARGLVESRSAACVNIIPHVTSVYRWKGEVEQSQECLLLIKTHRELWDQLQSELRKLHSYEIPEVIALSILAGYKPYLDWISAETS